MDATEAVDRARARAEGLVGGLAGRDRAVLEVDGRKVRLTHLGRPLFPGGETKLHLLRYLLSVAPALLPHLADRPLTLVRCPDGSPSSAFFQKNPPPGVPPWVATAAVEGGRRLLARTSADLALFAQWAAVELHVPPARLGAGGLVPDQLVVDLDPMPPAGWPEVRRAARGVRRLMEAAGVRSFPKLSGATGLHVYVPVVARPADPPTARVASGLGRLLASAAPDLYTVVRAVARRRGVYVDAGQNGRGRTLAAPYSVRLGDAPRVSAPLDWDEVDETHPDAHTIHTVPERLARRGDLFAPALGPPQPLSALAELAAPWLGRR
jgi:bifunctional non-homologous end joining protein LigD